MEFTTDAILTLATIAGQHALDREMIGLLHEAACQHRMVQRERAIGTLRAKADTGDVTAIAIVDRLDRETLPIPVYRENVEEAYRLLTETEGERA
jgi:hypothetical protein